MATKKITINELRDLVKDIINESRLTENVVPIGPDGSKITDQNVIRNLNLALKSVSSGLRIKLSTIISDPESAKDLRTPAQRAAMLGALAISFGITEKEFIQVIGKIKSYLPKDKADTTGQPEDKNM